MSDLNFIFSDESKPVEAFIVANQILDLRDTENGAIKISIDMLCKATLHKVIHKIAPRCSEHQANYIIVKMTRAYRLYNIPPPPCKLPLNHHPLTSQITSDTI